MPYIPPPGVYETPFGRIQKAEEDAAMAHFNHLPLNQRPKNAFVHAGIVFAVFYDSCVAEEAFNTMKDQGCNVHSLETPRWGNSSFGLSA